MDVHKRLSDITFTDIDNMLASNSLWKRITQSEKMMRVNVAVQKIANLLNLNDYDDYRFDTINDSDKVLAPTGGGLSSIYSDYIQIDIAADGTITDNDTTAINFNVESSSKSGTDPITYEITLSGGTIKTTTVVELGYQPVDWYKDTSANKITVVANAGHPAFSIFVKNYKES